MAVCQERVCKNPWLCSVLPSPSRSHLPHTTRHSNLQNLLVIQCLGSPFSSSSHVLWGLHRVPLGYSILPLDCQADATVQGLLRSAGTAAEVSSTTFLGFQVLCIFSMASKLQPTQGTSWYMATCFVLSVEFSSRARAVSLATHRSKSMKDTIGSRNYSLMYTQIFQSHEWRASLTGPVTGSTLHPNHVYDTAKSGREAQEGQRFLFDAEMASQ